MQARFAAAFCLRLPLVLTVASMPLVAGCLESSALDSAPVTVWGGRGSNPGQFQKPRGMAIDGQDQIYIVDFAARIQVFDCSGQYLRGWRTREHRLGKPVGLGIARDGQLLVADTHYHRVLVYSSEGELLKTVGGKAGSGPGEFGLVTDVAQDSQGCYYVSEYGENDRIQKFDPQWNYVLQWGGHGQAPGQMIRPQGIAVDGQDRVWVADSCNHRIQVFDSKGNLLDCWGAEGSDPGQLQYPYGLQLAPDGSVYVAEFGNHRLQKFARDGTSLGCWGSHGRQPGQLHSPWAVVCDRRGNVHVLDTYNHRVQTVRF